MNYLSFSAAPLSRPRLFRLLPLAGILFLTVSVALAQSTGSIRGRVFNATTNSALRNAKVEIDGGSQQTLTEDDGTYLLDSVASGDARVRVSFVGIGTQVKTVKVAAGTTVDMDFELRPGEQATEGKVDEKTVVLETFTVIADQETSAQAIALNERRFSANIKNVVAFDEYGDRGGENVGEFLRFLPGVGIEDGGQIASTLTLRGFPANNTGMQMDGAEIASARGDSRTQSLLDVPMANISRVEISKVLTPDMPASGLGGALNIITKRGFDVKKPVFSYQAYLITDSYTGLTLDGGRRGLTSALSPKYQEPSFDFSYVLPVNKSFAITVGGSRTWRLKPLEGDGNGDTQADWNFVSGFQRISTWLSLDNIIKTWSAQIGADWKISPRDTLSAGVQHRYVSNNIMRLSFAATYGAGATGNASFTQGASTGVGQISQAAGTNQETGADTTHGTLKYTHRGDTWRLDASGASSRSVSFLDDIDNGHFNAATATITGLVLRGEGTGESSDVIPTRYSATRGGAAVNVFDGGLYAIGNPTSNQNKIRTQKYTGRLDVTRPFSGRNPFTLKTGLFVDRTSRDRRGFPKTWTFTPNGSTAVAAREARNFGVFDQPFNAEAPTIYGQRMNWISLAKLYDLYRQNPSWFVLNEATTHQNYVAGSRKLTETISAGYLRGDLKLLDQRLWLVGGVRFERTTDDGEGALNDPTRQYQRNPNGTLVDGNPAQAGIQPVLLTTDALALARLRFVERGARAKRTYDGVYPSLSATYNLTDKFLVRAGYARTIGRPNINWVTPGTTFSEPTVAQPTITVSNTGLKPWTADGFDLALESYEIKGGSGSIGVFRKNIKDFFGEITQAATPELLERYGLPDDPLYQNYFISTRHNVSGTTRIDGLEFAYQQKLLFLPQWARGVQVFFNATRLDLGGSSTADFTGYVGENYAGGISLARSRFSVKLTFTYQGETRLTAVAANAANGIPADTYNYQGERLRVGINAQFRLNKWLTLYGSMTDINGPGFDVLNRQYAPGTPEFMKTRRRQELGSTIILGVKGVF